MCFLFCRVGKKTASREVGIFFFFFLISFFYKLECTGEKGKISFENMKKKKFQSALFSPLGRRTGNNFLFKGGLSSRLLHSEFRVPTAQGKQGKWPKKFPVRENTGNLEILSKNKENKGNFVNTGKTQGILLPQVVNVLILKVKDIVIVGAKKCIIYFSRSWIGLPSQFCVCNTHKLCKLAQGKFGVGPGKHRDFEIQFEWVP